MFTESKITKSGRTKSYMKSEKVIENTHGPLSVK